MRETSISNDINNYRGRKLPTSKFNNMHIKVQSVGMLTRLCDSSERID